MSNLQAAKKLRISWLIVLTDHELIKVSRLPLPFLTVALILIFPQTLEAREDWAVTVYGTSQLRGDIWETFYSPDFETSCYAMARAVSRKIYSFTKHLDLELEGQGVKHRGDQHHCPAGNPSVEPLVAPSHQDRSPWTFRRCRGSVQCTRYRTEIQVLTCFSLFFFLINFI
jgi:hypothetical protein